jgi:hypothetical protein
MLRTAGHYRQYITFPSSVCGFSGCELFSAGAGAGAGSACLRLLGMGYGLTDGWMMALSLPGYRRAYLQQLRSCGMVVLRMVDCGL